MNWTKLFLAVNGIGFILFGLYAFFKPEVFMALLGAPSMTSDGLYELRGIYGGVTIAGGFLILSGALKANMVRPALFFLLAYTGGYALARIGALPFHGMPGTSLKMAATYEIITALLSLFLLRRQA